MLNLAWGPGLPNTGSHMDQINYIAYMNQQHKLLFDKEFLLNSLIQNGFRIANLREFDASLDWTNRHFESLYCIAYV